eukprot:CAMPEP_0116027294 /NCGR_PEP_ID=MMETSP0321-20121206/14536_1 /TAXON_ID=163516 /ORGANISM="Leptocylindrus danicus var. danicus, Strain B650" /LENGTH=226 /DNA_ID=CAMNT_0003500607 /DNA_START=245 /DNA_END=925 /DNA_ORIENTATION=+
MSSGQSEHEIILLLIFILPLSIASCVFFCGWFTSFCQRRRLLGLHREALEQDQREQTRSRTRRNSNCENDQNNKSSREEMIQKALVVQKITPALSTMMKEQVCLICLSGYDLGENACGARDVADCVHIFHEECLQEWLIKHDDCPCCRRCIIPEEVVPDRIGQYRLRTSSARAAESYTSSMMEDIRDFPATTASYWVDFAGGRQSRRSSRPLSDVFPDRNVIEERV